MLTPAQVDEISTTIGGNISDDGEWAQVALECASQSGMGLRDQARLRDLLGLDCPDCDYCKREIPYLRAQDKKLWHSGGVLCQDPEGQP